MEKQTFAEWTSRLGLGTVQFGMDYGISNIGGRVSRSEVIKILDHASSAGISLLDTAKGYGKSEEVLGSVVKTSCRQFDIVSKLPVGCLPEQVCEFTKDSLKKLAVDRMYAYLAHSFADFENARIREALNDLRNLGVVEKIGVSVYFPREVDLILDENIAIDLIQLPFSVFDQRFLSLFPRLKERNIEIHARSVFLQGLFFLSSQKFMEKFPTAFKAYQGFRRLCEESEITVYSALLNFGLTNESIDRVLIGVTSSAELDRNLSSYQDYHALACLGPVFSDFSIEDERVILPFNWS